MSGDSPTSTSSHNSAGFDWETCFYLGAQLVGGIGLTVLLITMLWPSNKRRPRNPLLISMCFSWWLSTFPCLCILYYAGQIVGPPPTYHVCLASASLTMAQSILVACTGPALIFHIWLVVRTAIRPRFMEDTWIRRSILVCLYAPYLLFSSTVFVTISVGLRNPGLVHRVKFYCIVDDITLTKIISVCGLILVGGAVILEAWTLLLLYRHRTLISHLARGGHELDFSLVLRVCIFGLYVFLGLCLEVLSLFRWTSPIPDLFFSTFNLAVFIVFGTQPDIWRVWCQALCRVKSQLSRISMPNRLHARPPAHHPALFTSPYPSSANPLLTGPTHSRQESLYTAPSRPESQWQPSRMPHVSRSPSRLNSSRLSHALSFSQGPSSFSPDVPLPVVHRASRCDDGRITAISTPAFSNDTLRTPTSPNLPDIGVLHLDHTGKLSEVVRKPSATPDEFELTQAPRLDGPTFNAPTVDVAFRNTIDTFLVSSKTPGGGPARTGRSAVANKLVTT